MVEIVPYNLHWPAEFTAIGHALRVALGDLAPPGVGSPDQEWAKRYFRETAGTRRTHVHMRVAGRANQRYPLLFRDYLRAHRMSAEAYAEVKRRPADSVGEDRNAYVTIKDPVCDVIMAAAEDWARQTRWEPGPTDA